MFCPTCKNDRDEKHFRPGMETACVFCELTAAYKAVDTLEHFLNNHPPVGQAITQLCHGCKTLNFWVNLRQRGTKKYCGTCLDGLNRADEIEPKDLPAIADLFADLFEDGGKLSN